MFLLWCYEIFLTCDMKTTTVAVGKHFEDFIRSSIVSGRYNNASEVVRSGLRLLEDQEQKLAALRAAIAEGMSSGIVDHFDPDAHLMEMKARKHGNV